MLLVIKRIILFFGAQALIFTFASGGDDIFTGAHGVDQNFSSALNWKDGTSPVSGDNVYVGASGTSSLPAIIDAHLTVLAFNVYSYYSDGGGAGMSYAELSDSITLSAASINVGNATNSYFQGDLTLKTNSTVESRYPQSGLLSIGGDGTGKVVVESGVGFGHTLLNLREGGTLTFKFGNGGLSTFESTKTNAAAVNTLDGLLQVDFGNMNVSSGTYTLINGGGTTTLDGNLKDVLDNATDKKLTTNTTHFEVLNNTYDGGLDWYLTTADGGKDLQLVVGIIPEPNALSLVVVVAVGVMSMRRPRMSFTDKS